jgi:hypothetical protein
MAMTVPSPHTGAAPDLVTITEAVALLAECGKPYAVDNKTLRRWVAKHRVRTERDGKDLLASWSDILEVHRDEIDRRQA